MSLELPSQFDYNSLVLVDGEVVVTLMSGWTLRSGIYDLEHVNDDAPVSGEYVRLVDPTGKEILYWDNSEWEADPTLVMGAIINTAAACGLPGWTPNPASPPKPIDLASMLNRVFIVGPTDTCDTVYQVCVANEVLPKITPVEMSNGIYDVYMNDLYEVYDSFGSLEDAINYAVVLGEPNPVIL